MCSADSGKHAGTHVKVTKWHDRLWHRVSAVPLTTFHVSPPSHCVLKPKPVTFWQHNCVVQSNSRRQFKPIPKKKKKKSNLAHKDSARGLQHLPSSWRFRVNRESARICAGVHLFLLDSGSVGLGNMFSGGNFGGARSFGRPLRICCIAPDSAFASQRRVPQTSKIPAGAFGLPVIAIIMALTCFIINERCWEERAE